MRPSARLPRPIHRYPQRMTASISNRVRRADSQEPHLESADFIGQKIFPRPIGTLIVSLCASVPAGGVYAPSVANSLCDLRVFVSLW